MSLEAKNPYSGDDAEANAKDRAQAAEARVDLGLCPPTIILGIAVALSEGDLKYWCWNYRAKGVRAMVYFAACLRHLFKWVSGQEADTKTKVPHLWSAAACIAIIVDAKWCQSLVDDRPPSMPFHDMLDYGQEINQHLRNIFENGKNRSDDGPYDINSAVVPAMLDEKGVASS